MSAAGPRRALVPTVYLVLVLLWLGPGWWGGVPGSWPDALGTVWAVDAAPRLLTGALSDPLTGFPEGAHYGRPDSFVLLLLGTVFAWLPALWSLRLFTVVGLTATAWATERLARELGARFPASLLAGLGMAFCGLSSTAQMEGYPYHGMNPWLPLVALFWLRTLGAQATTRDGVLAALFFALTLLSTAWLGLAAVLLVVGLSPVAWGLRVSKKPVMIAAAGMSTVTAAYLALFLAGGAGVRETAGVVAPWQDQLGLALVSLAGPGAGIDVRGHSQTHWLGATVFALAALSPLALQRGQAWKALAGVAVVSVLLSISPRLDPGAVAAALPGPLGALGGALAGSVLRFPARLAWAGVLCASVLAARTLHRIGQRQPRAVWLLLGCALVDAFVVLRQPLRQGALRADSPAAYAAHEGPVLDVFAEAPEHSPAWTLWTTNLACFHQVQHKRPNAEHCLFTTAAESPRLKLQRRVVDQTLQRGPAVPLAHLAGLGFGSVMVHLDGFPLPVQEALVDAVRDRCSRAILSEDAGEKTLAVGVEDCARERAP